MKDLRMLLVVTVVLFPLSYAYSQEAEEDAEQSTSQQTQEQFAAEELYEQVTVLEVARTLQLTAQQIEKSVPLLQKISQSRQQLLTYADQAWNQHKQAIEQVTVAAMAGQAAPVEIGQNARQAVSNFGQQHQTFHRYLQGSAAQFIASLTGEQRQLIEEAAAPQRRAQQAMELEGAANLPEYIINILDTQRELMPDEYRLVRVAQAEQIAAKIVSPRSGQFRDVVGRVLELTDTVFGWPQEQYIQQHPDLLRQISNYLQVPLSPPEQPISYQELLDFLASPCTVPMLQRIAATPDATPLPSETRAIADHAIAKAIQALDLVSLLNDSQISGQQLSALLPIAEQTQALGQPLRDPVGSQGEKLKTAMIQARDLLLSTGQTSPEWTQFEEHLKQSQKQARLSIAGQLERVADILSPAQNNLIDWTPPPDILVVDSERMARRQRRLLAEMRNVVEMLERLRFRKMETYIDTRLIELKQLLEHYGITQDSPRYPEYRSFGIDILDRMRMTKWEDWDQARFSLALEFLRGVGVIEKPGERLTASKPITWEDIYSVFTASQTPQIIRQMLATRFGR